ncbi:MAG: hypothetical protein GEU79_14700 [Acidimicrobiia bacterium]|nr:hypothetical protein [Acidimicrobiia bacterium]
MRMRAHPLGEVRAYGELMLTELRKVIPSFLTRVDQPDRGLRWSEYLSDVRIRLDGAASGLGTTPETGPSVTLTDFDEDAENEVIAAALYPYSEKTDVQLLGLVSNMDEAERRRIFEDLVGDRANRRHKPGRAMERPHYRFDIVCDFGAFRDLQRHRLLTIDWQRLSTRLGSAPPDGLIEEGFGDEWETVMDQADHLYEKIRADIGSDVAQYVVPLGYNIRFVMEMNAREAFHLTELRSQPAGHPAYRWVATEMHRQIKEKAGHRLIADAMKYVDYSDVEWGRLEDERGSEKRRTRDV